MTQEAVAVFDFDGAMANTFEACPNGYGVEQAYEMAVQTLFSEDGLEIYKKNGGLRNRSPWQVVHEILRSADLQFLATTIESMERLIQERGQGLGEMIGYTFPESFSESEYYTIASELLVALKLEILEDQIGRELGGGWVWPRPIDGFCGAWRAVTDEPVTKTLVVSSGHTVFINKFLSAYRLPAADCMITDDQTRRQLVPVAKPDEHLIRMGLDQLGICPGRDRRIVFGDDPSKDGDLAKNADCRFVLIDPDRKYPDHPARVSSWSEVSIPLFS